MRHFIAKNNKSITNSSAPKNREIVNKSEYISNLSHVVKKSYDQQKKIIQSAHNRFKQVKGSIFRKEVIG
jgi:hypothetical protein